MKGASVFKKVLKTFIWIVSIGVIIFILIAVIIQIPSFQTRIVHFATSFVSKKTHTKVEIRHISISFPKSVVVEGLYLEDRNKDTLIYASKAKVNIALYDLLKSKIAVSSLALNDASLNLHSTKTDSLFNYNFLITSFSDTTKQATAAPQTPSKWTFSIDQVSLKDIRFRYDDEYSGMNVHAVLKKAEFNVDEIAPGKPVYSVFDLVAEGLSATVLATQSANIQNTKSGKVSPKIEARTIKLNNSKVSYTDSVNYLSVVSIIGQSKIENASIDLQKQLLMSESVTISQSKIQYHTFVPESASNGTVTASGSNWKVMLNQIDMQDDSVVYKAGNKAELKGVFDPDHVSFSKLNLDATNFSYSNDLTKVSVKKFNAIDQNNFAINQVESDFSMDQHSITAKNTKISTNNSTVDADLILKFNSLALLMDSLQFTNVNLNLRNLSFKNSDVLYFKQHLNAQPFFKIASTVTTASGVISGQLNNLNAKNLAIKTGVNTTVETDFNIKGLSNIETASYDFPNLRMTSGRKDLTMMAGSYIPKSIDLPENLSMQVVFKGKLKSFESTANLTSSFGDANLTASIDPNEHFNGKVSMSSLDLGRLLKDTLLYGPVTLTAEAIGQGLDMNTIKAKIKSDVSQIYLKQYTYHKLKLDGTVTGKEFEGKISLNDENAEFDFDGLVNMNPNQERYKFKLNLKGADLQKLKFTKKDARIAFVASADLKGGTVSEMNGTAGITNIIVASNGKKYVLDSFLSATVNEPRKSELNISSALIGIKYSGTVSPAALPSLLNQFINNYFPFSDSIKQLKKSPESSGSKFNFEIQLHNHPILSDVLFPQLKEFEPGIIQGSFDNEKNNLKMNATVKRIVYGTTEINDLSLDVNTANKALNYKISTGIIANSQIEITNFSLDGKLEDNKIFANISSIDGKKKKLLIQSKIIMDKQNYKLTLDPKEFYLANNRCDISSDNYIEFGKQGFLIHHLFINHAERQINIASVHDKFNDDLNIAIKNFRIDDIARIVEKDTSLVSGNVDGNILLKRVNNTYGVVADAKISQLVVNEVPIGDLTVKAENPTYEKFNLEVKLSGADNNLTANGFFVPNGGDNSVSIKTDIQSLSMKTIQALSMGQLKESTGTLTGNLSIEGNNAAPDITGELVFNNTIIKPAFLNNKLELKHETIQLKKDGVYFNSFTMLDVNKHVATIDGSVLMKHFSDFIFALQVNTKDFLLFNTSFKDNKEFYGRMVIDSKINVNGPMKLPVVSAKVKMKKGSNFTFSVPEDQLTTDKGEDVVEFDNSLKFNPILLRGEKKGKQVTGMTGFDLSSIIEIDKEATLRLLMDPASTDSLVVKGEAALSFTMDQSGKMSLTGAYNLNEGSYLVSLESVIKKKFDINAGSTIIWNGDPMEAEISIDASYSVRAAPYDLVADQLSGLSDVDKGGYKQRYPFLVVLKLRGQILHPEISFLIQLAPEDKGILGGAVNQKLGMLNEDESALNKQVFALLVLGRFVQENPFQTESSGGTSTLIRSTVGKFLSAQLNQLSSKMLPGMELNFDIQSYDDYQTGTAKGRTQVEIGVKKQMFNERLSVQLGGAVDVEGARASQNSASNITSDVTVEYKLTEDGRFLLKGFRHNQYEGAIEGQLVETGAGVVFVRDFNLWSKIFNTKKKGVDSSNKLKSNVKIDAK